MAKTSSMDLTRGSPLKQILLFSAPLVAGTLFQQLYSFIDTIMVGRLISPEALGAVGATSAISYMILGFVLGICFASPMAWSTALVYCSVMVHKFLGQRLRDP